VQPNAGALRPQKTRSVKSGAAKIFPAVAGWLRWAATGGPAELLCVDRAMRAGAELVDASDSGAVVRARASRRSLEE
jgi:hypothetical protein